MPRITAFIGVSLLFCVLSPSLVSAQVALPNDCSSADRNRAQIFSNTARQLFEAHDLAGVLAANRQFETSLSGGCRAALNRRYPARVRCSATEINAIAVAVPDIVSAVSASDLQLMIRRSLQLQYRLSDECWIAINRHTHPIIMNACDDEELDLMASYVEPALVGTQRLLAGDESAILQIMQLQSQVAASVRTQCFSAVQRAAEGAKTPGPGPLPSPSPRPSPTLPGWVMDHGGGTTSIPSLGVFCSPTGCIK